MEAHGNASTLRYTSRESLPHHRRVIRNSGHHATSSHQLAPRGMILNPDVPVSEIMTLPAPVDTLRYVTWNWMRDPELRCKITIPLCFVNSTVKDQLRPIVSEAIKMWQDALGPQRGIDFLITRGEVTESGSVPDGVCYSDKSRWGQSIPRDTVVIRNDGGQSVSHPGWTPLGPPNPTRGRMSLTYDPITSGFPDLQATNAAGMAHELGHIMGLDHEHQRYDAGRYIEVVPQNVYNIQNLDAKVTEFNKEHHFAVTEATVIDSYYWMRRMQMAMGRDGLPPLWELLPHTRNNDRDEVTDLEEDGSFDWDSIMLYGSDARSSDKKTKPTLRKLLSPGDTSSRTWGWNLKISAGDGEMS